MAEPWTTAAHRLFKKHNINQSEPKSETKTHGNERTNHNRQNIRGENPTQKSTTVGNQVPQNRLEEAKKAEVQEDPTFRNPNQNRDDSQIGSGE